MEKPIASCDSPTFGQTRANDSPSEGLRTSNGAFPGTDMACWPVDAGGGRDHLLRALSNTLADADEKPTTVPKYPGPQPLSIDSSHFHHFRPGAYLVATKHDGVRACMYFVDVGDRHVVCLFDRKMDVPHIVFIQNVPRAFCQGYGTVLDGELIYDTTTHTWTYVIFDCVVLCSMPQYQKSFDDRLNLVGAALRISYREDKRDTLLLMVKTFVPLETADPRALHDARFSSDGFVFMPRLEPIRWGHHKTFFKLKTCHSVDFMYKAGALYIFNQQSKRYVKAGTLTEKVDFPDGIIVECVLERYDPTPSKRVWRMLHVRSDKDRSNTLFVLDKTLLNIRERLDFATVQGLVTERGFQSSASRPEHGDLEEE